MLRDHRNVKRAMRLYVARHDLAAEIPLVHRRGLKLNDAWGEHARAYAWAVSAHLKATAHHDLPHARGCTQALTYALLAYMPPAVALDYVQSYWYAHRNATHYSWPAHNPARNDVPDFGIRGAVARWTDCSGGIRCMWEQLDRIFRRARTGAWPDPAGTGDADWGSSFTIEANCRRVGRFVSRSEVRFGDIVCFEGGVGHAQLYIRGGQAWSNGQEAGPLYVPAFDHPGRVVICRMPPFV